MSIRTCRHIEDLTDHDDMFLLLTSHVFSQTRVSITFSVSSCRWWDGGRGCCARRRARKGKLKDESLLASQTDASKGSYKPRFPSLNSLLRASFFPKFWKISINTNFLKGRAVGYGPLNWTIMVHVSVPRKLQVQPEISKGGIFLKKLWCYIGGEYNEIICFYQLADVPSVYPFSEWWRSANARNVSFGTLYGTVANLHYHLIWLKPNCRSIKFVW